MIQFIIPSKVPPGSVETAKRAIYRFVRFMHDQQPSMLTYKSLQHLQDPTRFIHVLIFTCADESEIPMDSLCLRQFVEVLQPLSPGKLININATVLD